MLHRRNQNQVSRPACRVVLPLLLNRLCDQQRRETIVPCREIFHLIGVGRKQDERLETAAAFPAVPNMTGALIAPVLRPFGGNQLITALNAFHPEAGTTIRSSRPHHSLRASEFT
jgi:hypothetical protein